MRSLKYQGYTIAFQEVPNEVSLVFNVGDCPYECRGCHSPELRDYAGRDLADDFDIVIHHYLPHITAVCFMGGDQNSEELSELCEKAHFYGLRTCLYTGTDRIEDVKVTGLDYLKVGHYDEKLGGLKSITTNQRFYQRGDLGWFDVTELFHGGVRINEDLPES